MHGYINAAETSRSRNIYARARERGQEIGQTCSPGVANPKNRNFSPILGPRDGSGETANGTLGEGGGISVLVGTHTQDIVARNQPLTNN